MRRISVFDHITLDGVMQAPGRADEDCREDFRHGGWSPRYGDEVMGRFVGERMARPSELLLGRRTYEDFAGFWPHQEGNPFSAVLTERRKHVASRTLREPLPWANSALLEGDAVEAVARLRQEPGDDLVILGSGELIRSLLPHGLIDELTLCIHPLVLGSGRRLFEHGAAEARLRLTSSIPTTTGVIIATYEGA